MALEKISSVDMTRFAAAEVNKRVSTKEQLRALQIARELGDEKSKEIYLSLCKRFQEGVIEEALRFVIDSQAQSKAKLFMWKVKQLRQEWQVVGKNPLKEVVTRPRRRKKIKPAALFDNTDLTA